MLIDLRQPPGRFRQRPFTLPGWGADLAKRTFDLTVGALLVALTIPLMAALAVAVAVSFRTWRPIFVHERVGRAGRRLLIPKLRTLPVTAPVDVDKYGLADVATTRVGRLLRATHLDELPQLVLVVAGRMSLVGPRPEMPSLARHFDPDFAAARSTLRPGCTGLWQISIGAERLIWEVPHYDLHYLRHRSFFLDGWILWRTLVMAITGARCHDLGDIPRWAMRQPVVSHRGPSPAAPSNNGGAKSLQPVERG